MTRLSSWGWGQWQVVCGRKVRFADRTAHHQNGWSTGSTVGGHRDVFFSHSPAVIPVFALFHPPPSPIPVAQSLPPDPAPPPRPEHVKLMFNAARLQQRVKHPNVLRVLGVFEDSEWPCILLEV